MSRVCAEGTVLQTEPDPQRQETARDILEVPMEETISLINTNRDTETEEHITAQLGEA